PDYAEGVHVSDDEEDDRKEHKLKHDHVKSSALNRIEQEDRRIRRLQGREEIHDDDRYDLV
ncbi:unnamed protein product, partial [Rotaria socialis]